jgi:Family of unknown function (DUF6236)
LPAFSSALYYPFIDIKNEHWLRNAALFWDTIRTIVPDNVREPYSKNFARALNDEGVLVPVRVTSDMDEIEALSDTVLEVLTDPAASAAMFGGYDPSNAHGDHASDHVQELANIHPLKLPMVVRSHFREALNEQGWYELNPGFANFYMTLLATRLAERLGLGLVTEANSADQLAIAVQKAKPVREQFSRHRPGRHYEATGPRRGLPAEVASGLLIDFVIRTIELPRNLPLKTILKFKRDHREELGAFRREIDRLTKDFSPELSIEALRQSVHDQYEAEVAPAMRSLKQSIQSQRWDTALNGLLKVSFFTAAPTSLAILAGLPTSVALIAGAGVSLTASGVLLANQMRQTKMSSPYSYLLSLEQRW